MSNWCSAVSCGNNSKTVPRVSFHRFPHDTLLRLQWLSAMRRRNWQPTSSSRLCSDHFTEDCFDESILFRREFGIGFGASRKLLKPGSVPTIFKPRGEKPTVYRGAYAKRRRKDLVQQAIRWSEDTREGPSGGPLDDALQTSFTKIQNCPSSTSGLLDQCYQGSTERNTSAIQPILRFKSTDEQALPFQLDFSCQVRLHSTLHKRIQAGSRGRSIGTQTEPQSDNARISMEVPYKINRIILYNRLR